MAVNSVNMTSITPGGPNLGLAGTFVASPGDALEPGFVGQATFTGDGSIATSNANFIDGTNAINFTPTGVRVTKIGGNDTANGVPLVSSFNNIAVVINWTAAIASGKTQLVLLELYK